MEADSPSSRGYAWTKRTREVKERDGETCLRCGREKGQNGSGYVGVCVHHIVPGRELPKEDARIDLNLVTVCHRCHSRLEDTAPRGQFRQTQREDAAYILDMLAEGRCTPAYIAEELGTGQEYIRDRLSDLTRLGLVEKVHRGLYELNEDDIEEE